MEENISFWSVKKLDALDNKLWLMELAIAGVKSATSGSLKKGEKSHQHKNPVASITSSKEGSQNSWLLGSVTTWVQTPLGSRMT